ATIPIGAGIDHVAIGQGVVWVVNPESGSIAQIDPVRNVLIQTIRLDYVVDLAVGEGGTWALAAGPPPSDKGIANLYKLDPERGRVSLFARVFDTNQSLGAPPSKLVVGDGSAWVTASFANQLYRVDLSTGALTKVIPTGRRPVAVAADASGSIWVLNKTDGSVWK